MDARLILLALGAAAVAPAAAQARYITFGSTLAATPTIVEAHPVDSAFWAWSAPSGEQIRVPGRGQILQVSVKGRVLRKGGRRPENRVFFQTLAPRSRGRRRVRLTSAPFRMPIGGNPDHISLFRPENLCARKGDAVAITNVGGFAQGYPSGAPFQMFAAVPGARTARFSRRNHVGNGDTLIPHVRENAELLMQVVLATGRDASGPCR